jgi:hypothetical protein
VQVLTLTAIALAETNQYVPIYAQPYYSPSYRQMNHYPPNHQSPYKPSYYPQYSYHQPLQSYKPVQTYNAHSYNPKELYCDATRTPKCAYNTTRGYCLNDPEYPEYEIQVSIHSEANEFKLN